MMFNKVPGNIAIEIILFVMLWPIALHPICGISQAYIPRTIMTYCTLDYSKQCRVEFGRYADTHDDAPPTNTMAKRL